jgi:nucleoside-diphosphate-sugar epimerase
MLMEKNNYLLTGANGFLGSIITKVLVNSGNEVISLGRDSTNINADITQPFIIDNSVKADIVIHAAGKAHSVPRSLEEEQAFFDANLQGTQNLCNALIKNENKTKAFIFISTVAVYGVDAGININENHPLNGSTPYARSKVLAEEWLTEWSKENNILLGILRLPLIVGPNPPGNLGAMINGIKSGRYLSIGKANARKSMVWGEDIARIIPLLAKNGGIFNLTDGYHPNFAELEAVISKALRKSRPHSIPFFIASLLGYAGDLFGNRFPINSDKLKKVTSTLTFDDAKARQLLNWSASSVLTKIPEFLGL